MRLRSLLFVPGDSERKFVRARDCGADALILDLEDSVAPPNKAAARALVASLIDDKAGRAWSFFVRVNALDTGTHRRRPRCCRQTRPRRASDSEGQRRGRSRACRPAPRRARKHGRHAAWLGQTGLRGHGTAAGDVRARLVCAGPSPADRAHLGRRGPRGGAGRDRQQGAGRRLDVSLSARPRAVPVRGGGGRSRGDRHRVHRLSRFRRASSRIAGARGATASSAVSRSTPTRSPSSTAPMRPPPPKSSTRAGSSPHSRPIPARARLESTARWSTFRT